MHAYAIAEIHSYVFTKTSKVGNQFLRGYEDRKKLKTTAQCNDHKVNFFKVVDVISLKKHSNLSLDTRALVLNDVVDIHDAVVVVVVVVVVVDFVGPISHAIRTIPFKNGHFRKKKEIAVPEQQQQQQQPKDR